MTREFPKRSERHIIGEEAVRALERVLPRQWIVRQQSHDYGIDVEIELAKDMVYGRICKAQVRGHEDIPWTKDGTYLQQVKQSTMNYWAAMSVPVLVVVPETSTEKVYWELSERGRVAGGVRVARGQLLPETMNELERCVVDWLDARNGNAVLYAMPTFVDRWERAQQNVGYDCFLYLEDEEFGEIQDFYLRVQMLRQVLGLPHGDILPWELWSARSRVTFGTDGRLYWGTYDELVRYLAPLVSEAIIEARRVLREQEAHLGNVVAKNWASHEEGTNVWYSHFAESKFETEEREFWAQLDERLRVSGILKYPAADGYRFQRKG